MLAVHPVAAWSVVEYDWYVVVNVADNGNDGRSDNDIANVNGRYGQKPSICMQVLNCQGGNPFLQTWVEVFLDVYQLQVCMASSAVRVWLVLFLAQLILSFSFTS